jgi:DNA-binding NarL/FixJ family response regulator
MKLSERLSNEDIVRIVNRYSAGVSSRDLAADYGINKTSVVALLRRRDIPIRNARITPEDTEEAKRLYAGGQSVATIGRKLNYSPKTIWNTLVKAGVKMRDTHGRER